MENKGEGIPNNYEVCDSGVVPINKANSIYNGLSIQFCVDIIKQLQGQYGLMGDLMLSCGMRPTECINLRVKHIDFTNCKIIIPNRLGGPVRTVFLPFHLVKRLKNQIKDVKKINKKEKAEGFGYVELPASFGADATSNKLSWQWLFTSESLFLAVDDKEDSQAREELVLTALSERLNRVLSFGGYQQKLPLTVDIFWRSYLAGV